MAADFVHLHLHTLYSLLDGAIRMQDLVETVREKKMSAVAVTDHGNLFGAVDFYKKAKDAGIKPIFGCEAYVAGPKGRKDRSERVSNHLVLLAKNEEGWRNLRYLVSMGYLEGHYYHPRIDKELLAKHSKGLYGLTACLGGEVTQLAKQGDMDGARKAALEYKEIFEPGHFFLEIQSNGMADQELANDRLKQLSRDLDIPLAATADSHYVRREDAKAHELLMCIGQGRLYDDPKRMRQETSELYIKSPEEMLSYFSDVPEAVWNTVRIAETCNVDLELGKVHLPKFQVPDDHDDDSYLAYLARTGLDRRFKELEAKYPIDRDEYRKRLEVEIAVIQRMGFSGYFLIVQDFINWAKKHNIPVGPGRGSGAGSLVAYALRITNIDPLPYGLLFERFLNPERVSMPDFDVDFCQTGREKVIDYVTQKYGEKNVGQIITFGQLSAKSAIKDVARVLGLSFSESNELTKNIPNLIDGKPATITKALEIDPRLRERMDNDPRIREVIEIAQALEGLNRQAGMHAAGVVIADKPLWEYVPLYQPSGEKALVTQFAKDEVEEAGLIKFDFLGLKTLTVIDNAIRMINENDPEAGIVADKIPLDDKATFQMISRGDTQGVFQLESSGFTELLRKLKPDCFEDIVAAVALYRPGPLGSGMIDDFIDRKHGRQRVTYPHPALEPILKPTYGVIVYQEQVMQIAQVMGGYSLGQADLLRRAMGKKKPEVMQKERKSFIAGAEKNGVDAKLAGEIFDLMEKFAAYGFNKSHSAAYAVLTMQTGWLKCHYPAEFMAALLTSDADRTDKLVAHIADAKARGIEVLPPDINASALSFHGRLNSIRFGLSGVKGVGDGAIEAILEARKDGPFLGLFDFCERVDLRRVNRKVIEALVRCGAFDSVGVPRWVLFASIEKALERGQSAQRDRAIGQASLFGLLGGSGGSGEKTEPGKDGPYEAGEPWTEKELLAGEKETIGFYVTGHPLDPYADEIRRYATYDIATLLARGKSGDTVRIVGVPSALRARTTKSGRLMGFATIEDLTGSVEVICFSGPRRGAPRNGEPPRREVGFEVWQPLLESDEPLLITGTVQFNARDEANPIPELIAEDIVPLSVTREERASRFILRLTPEQVSEQNLERAKRLFEAHPGKLPIEVQVQLPEGSVARLRLREHEVTPADELRERLNLLFRSSVVEIV